ncbi:MAG TPA: penicillin acylase family protein, partial [Thermoleophilaceae bacterium]|nr:penicillin acylase family protein [Thermoleophilaceae bacterium]
MRRFATATVGALLTTLVWAAAAGAQVGPYEDAADQFRNILPPGQNGHANAVDIAEFMATGERPPHNSDQLGMYEDLVYASPELRRSQIPEFFKDSSFGVPKGDREERYRPCGAPSDPCEPSTGDPAGADHPCREVTVLRDGSFGVPHIYGKTRAGTMCAAGYVAGEDRLLLVDILRHAGRAELSEFAGGTEGNRALDRKQWAIAPYRERDLRKQYTQFDDLYGRRGAKLQRDLRAYIAGLNQYRFEARVNRAQKLPGAYFALPGVDNKTFEPERFRPTDVVAIASLVGGIFGKGGGAELESAEFLQAAQDRFGDQDGEKVWEDFRSAEDPEAPTTVHGDSFPYMARPAEPAGGSLAIPDQGSLKETGVRVTTTSPTTDPVDFGLDLGGALLELGAATLAEDAADERGDRHHVGAAE